MIRWGIILLLYCITRIIQGKYVVAFQDKFRDCEGFENKVVDFSEIYLEYYGSNAYIQGKVTIHQDLMHGCQIQISTYMYVDGNLEYKIGLEGDICTQLENEDAPWYCIFDSLKIKHCPIKSGEYSMKNLSIDMDKAQDMMKVEYCGDYLTEIQFIQPPGVDDVIEKSTSAVLSCHEIYTNLYETNED